MNPDGKSRLNRIGTLILLIGLLSAIAIYVIAANRPETDTYANGVPQEATKRYVHDLEMYGGKAAVMADEFNRWFNGLWQGKNLAFTIVFIAAVTSAGFFFVARQSHGGPESEEEGNQPE